MEKPRGTWNVGHLGSDLAASLLKDATLSQHQAPYIL